MSPKKQKTEVITSFGFDPLFEADAGADAGLSTEQRISLEQERILREEVEEQSPEAIEARRVSRLRAARAAEFDMALAKFIRDAGGTPKPSSWVKTRIS